MTQPTVGVMSLRSHLGEWNRDGVSAFASLAERLTVLIQDGRIPLGHALPSERQLASALAVSRTTITAAYSHLRDTGFLTSRQGAKSIATVPATTRAGRLPMRPHTPSTEPGLIDLSYAAVISTFGVSEAYQTALQSFSPHLGTHGLDPVGTIELREQIAQRYCERGVTTTPDQILVTPGGQFAIRLILTALAGVGERVLVEQPTYPSAADAIRAVGARPIPVPLRPDNREPWDLDAMATTARQTSAHLAYVIPDHQNPTGLSMDAQSRAQLVRLAREARMTVIVDEVLAELNLDIEQQPPVASFAQGNEVITIGSMSKPFWAGLRVGWIRAHPKVINQLVGVRSSMDLGTPVLEQLAAAELLKNSASLLDLRKSDLRVRRSTLLGAVKEQLPDWRWIRGTGGLSTWFELPAPVSSALSAAALNQGVRVPAGPRFGFDGALERYLRIPYVQEEATLITAVGGLAAAYAAVAPHAAHPERTTILV